MEAIPRPLYLNRLIQWRDRTPIKVVSGVRRCGKSTLLDLFKGYLIADGVAPESIIHINFEDLTWEHLKDFHALHEYVTQHLSGDTMTYIFLDEVQEVPEFEKAVDSLTLRDNVDIYLTGSNAYFMSTELSTQLTGRYVEIAMLPLSFAEYCAGTDADMTRSSALAEAYRHYITDSSFPYALNLTDSPQARQDYLQGIYNSILLKDIVARHRVSDVMMLEDVTRFLLNHVGNTLSTTRIANTLTSAGRGVHQRTVEKYVTALSESLLFYQARRFDLKGKRLLERLEKYYVVDMGLRFAMLGGRGFDAGQVLENTVYLELIRRGFQVFIGHLGTQEVDFVATQAGQQVYVQVSATVRDPSVLDRELAPLKALRDSHPKILLTLDDDPPADYNGIRRTNV
ncbi:MAG: ATP-binding protein, partial [Propionibacteriaceae bacterium]|nr:ATP-binding protein [Propionibacteriaceae bacterium]